MKRKIGVGKVDTWEKPSKGQRIKKENHNPQSYENENAVIVIPAKPTVEVEGGRKRRVAAYCRVSTNAEDQMNIYEAQKARYLSLIESKADWELAGIYADRGLSGTAMKNRTELRRMIEDCKQGKIDYIITKSVERFSRNIEQCISMVNTLLSLKPPVPVFFETDNINSERDRFENDLFFSAFVAQQESVKKSRNIKWRWTYNFNKGEALMPTHCILGYDKDGKGNIVIVPREAKVVRFIYNSYLDGMRPADIAAELTKAGISTVRGCAVWKSSVILSMLRNEKYVGDAKMQKTYTPDCLTHKSVRNTGQMPMYYKKNHHIAIISRSDWDEVQRQLPLRLYQQARKPKKEKKFMVKHVKKGTLQGFSIINPKWSNADKSAFIQMLTNERGNENETV